MGQELSDVEAALDWLKRRGTKTVRDGMARYALPSDNAFGVSVSNIQLLAKRLGKSHELAAGLWKTGWHEARMLAAYVDEPERVTSSQMDRWCRDFDNWGICDTICFVLFDRTSHAFTKVTHWSERNEEFVKRAAFALLWGLTVHDKSGGDKPFVTGLRLIEKAGGDERLYVKKAVNMALRAIGKRNPALNTAAVATATRLAKSSTPSARWIGQNAFRELTSPSVKRRLTEKRKTATRTK